MILKIMTSCLELSLRGAILDLWLAGQVVKLFQQLGDLILQIVDQLPGEMGGQGDGTVAAYLKQSFLDAPYILSEWIDRSVHNDLLTDA
jgi:hypothetical protein